MIKQTLLKTELFGYEICAHVTRLDEGIQVLIAGGSRTHIGVVSFMGYNGNIQTLRFPGHKDGYVSTRRDNALWESLHDPSVSNAESIMIIFVFGSSVYSYALFVERNNSSISQNSSQGDWLLADNYDRKGAVFPGGWLLPDIIVCAPMEERGLIMRENFSKGAILLAQALIAGLII